MPAATFDSLKDKAQMLESPEKAVNSILGVCQNGNVLDQQDCRRVMQKEAKKYKGKLLYLDLGSDQQELLRFEKIRGDKARFLWTPMWDPGHGRPITIGRPLKLRADGGPVLKLKILDAKVEPGTFSSDLARAASTGNINIEIVGTFAKPWRLRRGGNSTEGIMFKLKAIRLSHARTGKTMAEITY
jgi:hypothetical protein